MTLQAVLFDLDGTLVDTNYLHVHAWWEAFREQGHQVSGFDIHRAIGLPSADLVRTLLGEDDEAVVEGHSTRWAELRPGVQAFHRAGDLLRACADKGWKVVWATSGSPEDIEVIRKVLDADDAIHAVVGSADVDRGKPHPDVVQKALDGIDPADAVMLGDTVWDVRAAGAAGVRCIGVLAGGIGEKELRDAGAAAVVGNPADLLADLSLLGQ
jgi:phosphoglycolate phosphatase-like HAD superfamily hydrolase